MTLRPNRGPGRERANAYMPFAEDDLARKPVLPAHLKTLFLHEMVIARDLFWMIAGGGNVLLLLLKGYDLAASALKLQVEGHFVAGLHLLRDVR